MKPVVIATLVSLASSQTLFAAKEVLTGVTVSGFVQTEIRYNNDYDDVDSSDIAVDEINFTIEGQAHKFAKATLSFKYEEDSTPLEIDNAYLTLTSDSPLYLEIGQLYVPFGNFSSHMVTDPLTKFAEARESAAKFGMETGGFYGSVYGFNGVTQDDARNTIDHYGMNLGFGQTTDSMSFDVGVGYISDIGDSGSLEGIVENAVDYDYVDGVNVYANLNVGALSFMSEYITALDNFKDQHLAFNGAGAEPKACNAEVGFNFNLAGYDTTFAIGYQTTEEALALQLPEERVIGVLSAGIYTNTSLSLEYALNEDYSKDEGGTGEDSSSVILQLAVQF
ncbi:LbtU family siderophore porin [Candidatus Halobeggiatoa sp. HSG11]|nr:LbtU family siderophore porin [Candidatus Halobeggiatoa sp. HSG11]